MTGVEHTIRIIVLIPAGFFCDVPTSESVSTPTRRMGEQGVPPSGRPTGAAGMCTVTGKTDTGRERPLKAALLISFNSFDTFLPFVIMSSGNPPRFASLHPVASRDTKQSYEPKVGDGTRCTGTRSRIGHRRVHDRGTSGGRRCRVTAGPCGCVRSHCRRTCRGENLRSLNGGGRCGRAYRDGCGNDNGTRHGRRVGVAGDRRGAN